MRIESERVSRSDCFDSNGRVDVDQAIQRGVQRVQDRCDRRRIAIHLDLIPVQAAVDAEELAWVIDRLLDQAIERMPGGGELSITLVDTRFQWELEIADSAPMAHRVWYHDSGKPSGTALVHAIPIIHDDLETVHQIASRWNGVVQSCICPQGGTAHILVVPHLASSARAA